MRAKAAALSLLLHAGALAAASRWSWHLDLPQELPTASARCLASPSDPTESLTAATPLDPTPLDPVVDVVPELDLALPDFEPSFAAPHATSDAPSDLPLPIDVPRTHDRPLRRRESRPEPTTAPLANEPPRSEPPPLQEPAEPAIEVLEASEAATIESPSPRYPRDAVAQRLEGEVTLLALVRADGTVNSCEVEQSSGHALLDEAAKAALAKWLFKPRIRDGEARPFTARIPFRFFIPAKPAPHGG